MSYWEPFPKSGPRRPAKDGIAAKKQRGAIGDTWWSKRFVTVLEAFTGASRLQRGRSYARTGQVTDLAIGPGAVTAKVQGSRPRPYDVRLAVTVLTEAQWGVVVESLASQALYAAALLGGQMPREIEEVFTEVGLPLFPRRSADVQTSCSCPDSANPCKHVAATYYILAERFDADPFAILAWRGRDREALVADLRGRRTSHVEAAPMTQDAPLEEALPLGDAFWHAGTEALALRFRPDAEGMPDALPRRLGPLASGKIDLVAALAPAWSNIAAHARTLATRE